MVWSGMCHSDEHLRTGDISAPPEVLEMIGVKSMFPVVGGHEGSGVVTEVGPNVTQVAVGDHVAVAFIPSCGTCFWCASGRQNLCDLGMMTLAGGMISDGTYRYHLGGENVEPHGAARHVRRARWCATRTRWCASTRGRT